MTSRVVPGYVVLSSTMSIPWCARRATASAAAITYDMSGSRVFASGVGTAIEIVSARAMAGFVRRRDELPALHVRRQLARRHVLHVRLAAS